MGMGQPPPPPPRPFARRGRFPGRRPPGPLPPADPAAAAQAARVPRPLLYTCVADPRDQPPRLPDASPAFEYILYCDPALLDRRVDVGPWAVRPLLWRHPTDPERTVAWHKLHPLDCFPHYESSIWVDPTHWPTADVSWLPAWFLEDADLAAFRHPTCWSSADLVQTLLEERADDPERIRAQLGRYFEAGFPAAPAAPLPDATVLIRRHNPVMRRLADLWWAEVEAGSRCVELSLPYCLWRSGMRFEPIVPGHARHPSEPLRRKGSPYFNCRARPLRPWPPDLPERP